ncbi:zf-DHHC-domain-containing protein [Ceraceosorus guamensis]|uniref:Palmitoyltransferase n=1 Tax=Ceraceosorus guamensis TaxID=1522189 RepID=A0A316VWL1_9BASI|nr:zf-DHHC-domain-containing protein [Ceraceosorus guamensis]PWN42006.1 zf-DHHC-domain-containing protein [Ceraceosorus guamensis]
MQERPAEKPSSYPRKWKSFQGANKFFCFGRIMTADDNPLPFFGATLVVVAFPILWFIFVAPFTWRHVSPAPVILTAYTWLVTLSSMMVTSWRDPGVLPRDLDPDPPCTTSDGDPMDPEDPLAIPLPRVVRVPQSTDLKVKWCETCGTYRPPRASHCRTCDNCVENIDHHCTFLNTCIGRRNYFSFFSFLIAGITLCCLCLVFSAVHLYLLTRRLDDPLPGGGFGSGLDFAGALRKAPLSAVLFLVPIWVLVPLCVLFGYHMRLVSMNRTTVEQIRINSQKEYGEKSSQPDAVASHRCVPALGRPGRDPNPFAVPNFFANAFEVLCRPIPESYIDRSGRAVPDNRRPNPAWRNSSMGRQASDIANDGSPRV